ncbi:telomeric repeat-binding factor 2-interacting protein 1-like [Oculina patagonica]
MAESSEGDELPRCSTLFLTEDGSQMHFYMTPCAMKTRLRPLITDGGGHLSSKVLTDSIK